MTPLLTAVSLIPSILASYVTLKRLIKANLSIWQLLINGVFVGGGIGHALYPAWKPWKWMLSLGMTPTWFFFSILTSRRNWRLIALSTQYYVEVMTGLKSKVG